VISDADSIEKIIAETATTTITERGATRLDDQASELTDGLQAEREQGITIDVAYRYFTTGTRKFIIADAPGHEQYTRNMVTAASTANLAIILVDARRGVLTQTRRHSHLAHLVGIPHLLVAVNKMDLVDYSQVTFKLAQPLLVDPYTDNRATGAFIVIDESTNNTVGAGMVV
jgi:sulfate adenylyltransferase subunit 1